MGHYAYLDRQFVSTNSIYFLPADIRAIGIRLGSRDSNLLDCSSQERRGSLQAPIIRLFRDNDDIRFTDSLRFRSIALAMSPRTFFKRDCTIGDHFCLCTCLSIVAGSIVTPAIFIRGRKTGTKGMDTYRDVAIKRINENASAN